MTGARAAALSVNVCRGWWAGGTSQQREGEEGDAGGKPRGTALPCALSPEKGLVPKCAAEVCGVG